MKKIAIGILMPFLWVNLSLASGVFDLFIKKDNTQEMREQYRIEREKAREERRMREKQKKSYQANQTYTPQSKKELIALLRKPKIPLQNIDVSQIKDMSYLFDEDYGRSDLSGIEDWDVRATKMSFMFSSSSITKLPKWYVEFILKHPTYTPQSREELEQILRDGRVNLAEIDVVKIQDFSYLFRNSCRDLLGIEFWDMSGAESLEGMFESFGGKGLERIKAWNPSGAKNMKALFVGSNIEKYPLWYVEFVKKNPTFRPKTKDELVKILKQYQNELVGYGKVNGVAVRYMALPLIEVDVSEIKDLSYVFCSSKRIEKCSSRVEDFRGIEYWDVSGVENLERVFMGSKINADLSAWKVGKVKNFYEAFAETPFNQNISDWEVSKEANVERVFFDSELEREDKLPAWAE